MKVLPLIGCLALLATGVYALDLLDIPNEAGPAKVKELCIANNALLEADAVTQASTNAALLALFTARSFSTTGALAVISTAYTPRYLGDTLYNVTSNRVWFAKALTTNDWILLN